jgi:hypothetical protein
VEVAGGWRGMCNGELHNFYVSPNVSRVIKSRKLRWEGYIARVGEMKSAFTILDGRPEGRRRFGRPRHRCEDNIRMDLRVRRCGLDSSVSL